MLYAEAGWKLCGDCEGSNRLYSVKVWKHYETKEGQSIESQGPSEKRYQNEEPEEEIEQTFGQASVLWK